MQRMRRQRIGSWIDPGVSVGNAIITFLAVLVGAAASLLASIVVKDTISVGILPTDQQIPDVERVTHDEASIRRLVSRLGEPRMLRACYEAGPTGEVPWV